MDDSAPSDIAFQTTTVARCSHHDITASSPDEENTIVGEKLDQGQYVEPTSSENEIIGVPEDAYMSGWKLHTVTIALCLSLFMAGLDTSIVSTSILNITDDLGGFDKSSWIFTAYLLTYSGLVITWAKLSDVFGRKPIVIITLLLFTAFSGACGGSHTLIQLIMFRCCQGIGGSGIYSLSFLVFYELVPPRKYPTYTSIVSMTFAAALAFGPLIGGLIDNNTTWRWIFYINLPLGGLLIPILVFILPATLPNEGRTTNEPSNPFSHSLKRVYFVGTTLLIGACILLVTPLQQAANGESFSSPTILPLLVFSGLTWIGFFMWSWFITTRRRLPEPVFPWRFIQSRICVGMILTNYFSGTILTVCITQIPQRFQTVHGDSPLTAGVRLIPFGVFIPVGAILGAGIVGKTRILPLYVVLAGIILQIVGTVGLSVTPLTFDVWPAQYGFQIIEGTGIGIINAIFSLIVPFVVEKRDLAVAQASIAQFRVLGGIVGLAIITSVTNRMVRSDLLKIVSANQVEEILDTPNVGETFSEIVQLSIMSVFGRNYNLQMKVMIGFAVAQIPATMMMWTKKPITIQK